MKNVALLVLSCASAAVCQLPQLQPELCGAPNGVISLPPGFSILLDRNSATLQVTGTSTRTVTFPSSFADSIDEACPLPDGKIVVFAATTGSTAIFIVDPDTPAVLDHFGGWSPIMSPDRRWIALRKPYPAHGMELPASDEYLVYDLSRNPGQNRPSGVTLTGSDAGLVIFPPGQGNLPMDNIGLPYEQLHTSRSIFYWSPDSHAIVFADELMGKLSLLLMNIKKESKGTMASVYPIQMQIDPNDDACSASPIGDITFGPEQETDRLLLIEFAAACKRERLQLHSSDFAAAKPESHPPVKYTRRTVKANP